MSVCSVLIGLQVSYADGRGVTAKDFLDPLRIVAGEVEGTRATGDPWMSGMVYFGVTRLGEHAEADEPDEAFFGAVTESFRRAARFLDARPVGVIGEFRRVGLKPRIFVDVRMDQDQMELELPPDFLVACGRHGLSVYMISNDIAADEAMTASEPS